MRKDVWSVLRVSIGNRADGIHRGRALIDSPVSE